MVGAGLGPGMDHDGPGPQLFSARPRMGGRGAIHSGGLRRVAVELVGVHDSHAGVLPLGFGAGGHVRTFRIAV